jgi:NAD+ diphosphatase
VIPAPEAQPDALAFAFLGSRLLLHADLSVPAMDRLGETPGPVAGPIPLGELADRPCYAVALSEDERWSPAPDLALLSLRELFARTGDDGLVAMASRAWQLLHWWFAHAFCGWCGSPTELHEAELARVCGSPACGRLHYPRISPAVITLVHRDDGAVLLAADRRFRPGFFALIAGFVEPGETLEEAVAREVREEVGVEVDDVRYVSSQAWPFPSQLMVGFTARYRSGEIVVQESEISEARWFPRDGMPEPAMRPAPFSIAGRLLARYLESGVRPARP